MSTSITEIKCRRCNGTGYIDFCLICNRKRSRKGCENHYMNDSSFEVIPCDPAKGCGMTGTASVTESGGPKRKWANDAQAAHDVILHDKDGYTVLHTGGYRKMGEKIERTQPKIVGISHTRAGAVIVLQAWISARRPGLSLRKKDSEIDDGTGLAI